MDPNQIIPPRTGAISWLGLALWLALCFVAAWIGSRFQPGQWYKNLSKPSHTPPSWVFAPVWTVLYVLMAVAAWLVWRRYGFAAAALPLSLFVGQLALNALWSYVFFGLHKPGLAFLNLAALWLILLVTLITFWQFEPPAGQLLLPYLLWVTFAGYLNLQVWRLNT